MDSILNISVLTIGLISTFLFLVLYFTKLKSKQLLNYLPNVWTSLGILGTFIAIVYSLEDLQNSSSGNEINVIGLIEDIAPAFITSIIGICGAIITSIVIKITYAIEEKKEERIYADTVGGNISPELMLDKINRSIEKLINVTTLQETNIKSFLNNYMLQLDAFYNKIFESNKEQVQTLSDEYVHSVAQVLAGANEEINKRIDALLLSHSESIQEYLKTEKAKLDEVANDIKTFLKGVPESVDEMKVEMIDALRNAIIEKYNQLLEGNDAFTNQLLERVRTFESELSSATSQNCSDTLSAAQSEIQRVITLLEDSLKSHIASVEKASTSLSTDLRSLVTSVNKSIGDYEAMVEQLDKLIPVLQEHVKHSENNISVAEQNSAKLVEVLSTLEEIVKKNQQLRYELTQWKRVHKKVKINDKNGTKECPNCGAENPMDANFCRKCNYGFWDCETIASSLK
ncbi:zinc ribbon domain-containing protein [Parabacteroides pacaensis]|uniref:zinc ribbon domain-containing protein n=1 Tax=Parabacteroides pacaensis TaxID=2086575 RepID=UPI000D11181B|nr:zinc ribbon domain-containing protein [Parabacteroides pacaensis]